MILTIYKKAFAVLLKRPFVLWGISLLQLFLSAVAGILFGIIPGVALAIGWLLSTSMTLIYLHGYRGQKVNVLMLFDCFRDWKTIKRVLCGIGWMTLWIVLWALIPVVGWIFALIRVYRYRLTPYILMQEPDVAPTEAIKLSRQRTEGWKGRMFGADVLVLVGLYVALLILGLLSRIPFVGVLFGLILTVFAIVCFALLPLFLGLVKAAFYEEIKAEANGIRSCPKCGTFVHAESAYCQNCGAPLNGPSSPAPISPEPPAPEEAARADGSADEAAEEASAAVEEASEAAEKAQDAAEEAAETAEDAQDALSETAGTAAEEAQADADSAEQAAEQVLEDAETAASDMLDQFSSED